MASVDRETLYDLYVTKRLTVRAVATECGLSPQRVSQLLWKYRIQARPRSTSPSEQQAAKVLSRRRLAELYWVEEMSMAEVAKKTGFSVAMVRKYMIEHGIPMRSKGAPPAGRKSYLTGEQLTKLLAGGFTVAEIAELVGCSTETVIRSLKRHGLR